MHFAGERPGYTSRPSIAPEWDRLAAVYISKTCRSFAAAKKPPLRKIMFELNRWLANSPTHIKKYF
jgi:hypothetical protein